MSDLLNLNILYRLPADGWPICLDDLAAALAGVGFACTQAQIAASLDLLCEQGMAVQASQGQYARADRHNRAAGEKRSSAELMAQITATLIHNDTQNLEDRITDALGYVARFTDSDRAYVFEYDFGRDLAHYRYEWCAPGISAQARSHASHSIAALHADDWIGTHQRGEPVVIDDAASLTNPDLRHTLTMQHIKSLIAVPIMADAQCLGFIGFDSVKRHRRYGEEDIRLLETLARMLANLHWKEINRLSLARANDSLDIIVEGAGVGTWIWWMSTGHLEINEAWASMLGYTRKELEPATVKTWERLTHPEDLPEALALIEQYLDGRLEYYDTQFRMRHKAGHWVPIQARARLIHRHPTEGVVMVGVHHDITGLEQTHRELKLLSDIISRSHVLAFRWANQPGWPVEYVSPTIERFGYKAEDFINGGTTYRELIHPDDADSIEREVAAYIAHGPDEYRQIYRLRHGQGHWIWVDDFSWLTRDQDGTVTDINGVLLDITQRKRLEQELQLSEHRLQELFEKLPVAITMHEPETGAVLEANRLACKFHGVRTLAQLQAIDIWNQPEPFSRKDALEWIRKTLLDGRQSFEWRSANPDGNPFWQAVTLEPIAIDGAVRILAVSIDINEKVLAQQALAQSEARFRGLLEHLPNVAVQGCDRHKRVIFWNHGSEVLYGYSAAEAVGRNLVDLLIPEEQQAGFSEMTDRWLAGEIAFDPMEMIVRDKQGARKSIFSSQILRHAPNGELEFYCVDVDLTTQKQTQQRLELLARVFSHSYDGVVITDKDARVVEVNDRYCEITGYSRAESLGQNPSMLHAEQYDEAFYAAMWEQLHAQGYWVGEIWNRKKSGERYSVEIRITALKDSDGVVMNYIANVTDITERLHYEEKLKHVAFYDQLTGLPNRSSVSDTLQQAVANFNHRDMPFAVVFIDLDEFKAVNDDNGHEMGDRYLQSVARRLQSIIREGDVAARFGGDEFVLILQNQQPATPNHPVFNRLLAAMHDPVVLDGKALRLTASFGVTFYPQDSEVDADQLLRQADQAMYSAKQHGKNQIVYFDAEFERAIMLRNARITELKLAIEHGEMVLHYQPQVDMATGRVLGVEALVRWNHPSAGLLYPNKFLNLIQEHEPLSLALSKWALARSLSDLARLRAQGHELGISVNIIIPAQDNLRTALLNDLHDILQQHPDTPPELLTLEVVENILIDDLPEATRTLNKIQQLGVQISLDDFGTGFSSLSYLKHLSFDELKIDQEFVRDMLSDREDMTIVQAVVSLSQSFDVSVIGEGVETGRHAEMLLRLGCVKAQGYAISRPLAIDTLEVWLEEWRPDPAWKHIAPISPHFYQVVANLSGYAGWVAGVERYLHGQAAEAPAWSFGACSFAAQLQSSAGTHSLWHKAQEYEQAMLQAGLAAINVFQQAGLNAEGERHLALAAASLEALQQLVWSRLV